MTPHFSLEELTVSAVAKARGISNRPDTVTLSRMQVTAYGLECVRLIVAAALGAPVPIRISSCYRSPAVNRAVGGTDSSDHLSGWAADITADGVPPLRLAEMIRDSGLAFHQMILEGSRGVVHVSFDPLLARKVQSQPGGPGTPLLAGLRMA